MYASCRSVQLVFPTKAMAAISDEASASVGTHGGSVSPIPAVTPMAPPPSSPLSLPNPPSVPSPPPLPSAPSSPSNRTVVAAATRTPSERDVTEQDSSIDELEELVPLSWRQFFVDRMREKRKGATLGWLDRWDLFGSVNLQHRCIANIANDHDQATLRRRLWLRLVIHTATITVMAACCAFWIAPLADWIRDGFRNPWHRVALLGVLCALLVVLKLVLHLVYVRYLVFTVYSMGVAVFIASEQLAFACPAVVYCCAVTVLIQIVILVLCGVQYETATTRTSFLSVNWVGCITCMAVPGIVAAVHNALPNQVFWDGKQAVLATMLLLVVAALSVVQGDRLFNTLAPRELPLAPFCTQLDLFVATIATPGTIGLLCAIGIPYGLLQCAVMTPVMVWQYVRLNCARGFTCGIKCHLFASKRPTSAQVAVENRPANQ